MNLTWLGHAALRIEGSRTVFIDPFLSGNPAAAIQAGSISKADVVVVTHEHGDHLGDSYAICKKNRALFVGIFEIAENAAKQGIETESMNVGGTVQCRGVDVSLVPAIHSALTAGVVIQMDGKTIYHAGDTCLTTDMQWIGEMFRPDISFLPIDGRFNMTPRLAARAVEWLKTPRAVPIHYGTFPFIQSSPEEFKRLCLGKAEVIILKPGESVRL